MEPDYQPPTRTAAATGLLARTRTGPRPRFRLLHLPHYLPSPHMIALVVVVTLVITVVAAWGGGGASAGPGRGASLPVAGADPGAAHPQPGEGTGAAPDLGPPGEDRATTGPRTPPESAPNPSAAGEVIIHIIGEVKNPGLVRLPAGARVVDAVTAAGGMTDQAAPGCLNLAAPLVDGTQLVVLSRAEFAAAQGQLPGAGTLGTNPGTNPGANPGIPGTNPGTNPGRAGKATTPAALLALFNSGSQADLEALPGIGPALASRIIADRHRHGPFRTLAEVTRVPGVGPKLIARLQ